MSSNFLERITLSMVAEMASLLWLNIIKIKMRQTEEMLIFYNAGSSCKHVQNNM